MTAKLDIQNTEMIDRFIKLIQRGINCWVNAGELLVKMTEEDPDICHKILSHHKHISEATLDAFLRIGRKEVHPYLIMDPSPAAKRLAALPYEDQLKIYNEGLPVVVEDPERGLVRQFKKVHDVTAKELAVVFQADKIRTVKEQIEVLTKNEKQFPEAQSPTLSDGSKRMNRLLNAIEGDLKEVLAMLSSLPKKVAAPKELMVDVAMKAINILHHELNTGEIYTEPTKNK